MKNLYQKLFAIFFFTLGIKGKNKSNFALYVI